MGEQLKNAGKSIVDFWKKLSKKIKIIIISVIAVLIIGSVVLSVVLNKTDYIVLFSGLSDEEVTEVMNELKEKNVEYKYQTNGEILIPKDNESLIRMQLAEEGYPHSGLNYDLFTNNIDFMTTDYEKRKYELFQLQERIAASVETITGVKKAIVNIAIPETDNYAWDNNKQESSATIKINMITGYELTDSQITGITNLIRTSVVGLKAENIAIVDTEGNDLTANGEIKQTDTLKIKIELEKQIQKDIENNIGKLLSKAYGVDNYEVSAKCTVNLDKKISENLKYTPNEDTNKGVVNKEDSNKEVVGEGKVTGGVVGTENNSEVPVYPDVTIQGDDIYYKDKSSIDYLVNQLKEQIQYEPGNIEKLTVAVIINKEKINDDEKNNLKELIAYAAGTEVESISLLNLKFDKEVMPVFNPEEPLNFWASLSNEQKLLYSGIGFGVLIFIIIITIIIKKIKKAKRKKLESELLNAAENGNSKDSEDSWEDIKDEIELKNTKEAVLKKQITDFASGNPDIAAQLIRTWMKGDDK